MVQYFRNYIVRPVGSLSATSTVDSLSSSCICIANEANTLVPPPYSRAASPDLSLTTHSYGMPRSASDQQQGCSLGNYTYQSVPVFSNDDLSTASNIVIRASDSATIHTEHGVNSNTMHLSRSDQQFKQTMITHSISNLSIPVLTGVDVATISQTINTQNTNSNDSTNSYSSMNAIYNIQQQLPCDSFSEESPINGDILQKFNDMRRYVNSTSGSAISSLNNVGTPDSPPRATSPTEEVKELLEQIRQLQKEDSDERIEDLSPIAATTTKPTHRTPSIRPSSLHRKDFFAKKVRYVSITNAGATKSIRSPLGSGCSSLLGKGRSRKGWKSAPTTPATALPPCFLDDDSQSLLNEQDEDAETN